MPLRNPFADEADDEQRPLRSSIAPAGISATMATGATTTTATTTATTPSGTGSSGGPSFLANPFASLPKTNFFFSSTGNAHADGAGSAAEMQPLQDVRIDGGRGPATIPVAVGSASASAAASPAHSRAASGHPDLGGSGGGGAANAPAKSFWPAMPAMPVFGRSPEQSALAAKEAELQRREAELAAREAQLSGGGKPQQPPPKAGKPQQQQQPAVVDRSNNFPSCWPLVYHNLSVDIPPHVRHLATYLYVGWSAFVGLLLWNAVACFSMLVAHAAGVTTAASDFGLSVMYGLVLPVVSFISWYRPVYRAFARNSSLGFMVYFVFGSMHIMFCGYMALGIPGSGSAGGINMIAMFTDKKILAGVCCAIAFVGWAVSGLYFLVLLKRVHSAYRNGGMSMEGAQNEALQSVASNGAVRSAALRSLF